MRSIRKKEESVGRKKGGYDMERKNDKMETARNSKNRKREGNRV